MAEPQIDNIDPYIKGFCAYNQNVAFFTFANVVVAKNYKEIDKVRLLSGGTSPQIEYVGKGMLTASIQGSCNNSAVPSEIQRTLRELSVDHVKGILVIVRGNSTDVLNFGLAAEKAGNYDIRVMLVSVVDDCKNKELGIAHKRGLSGVVLVNKIAGALADYNKSLRQMHEYCQKVADSLISASINVKKMFVVRECVYCKKCALDVDSADPRKKVLKKMEPGDNLPEIVNNLFSDLLSDDKFALNPGDKLIVLVNNLGAFSKREESLFLKECITYLDTREVKIARFYIGNYLQLNLDLDLTITILKIYDNNLISLLDHPVEVPGWKPSLQPSALLTLDNQIPGVLKRKLCPTAPIKGPKLSEKSANILQLCLQFACEALISCEKMLNKMDSEKGDGDTGTRLRLVADVLNKKMCQKNLNLTYPFSFFLSLSYILGREVGGTMGCIYQIVLEAAANKFAQYKEEDEVGPQMWLEALESSCQAVKKYCNVDTGDQTMYDPLQACASTMRQYFYGDMFIHAMIRGVTKAEEAAQNTRKPGCKFPDPGAHAVGIWLRAVCEGVKLRCIE